MLWRLFRNFHRSPCLHILKVAQVPQIGEGLEKLTIGKWLVSEGSRVAELQEICEAEGDKGSTSLFSRYTGVLKTVHVKTGSVGKVGSPLYSVEVEDGNKAEQSQSSASQTIVSEPVLVQAPIPTSETTLAMPSARMLAKEKGIDLRVIKGTGKHGAIRKEDVMNYTPADSIKVVAQTDPLCSFNTKPMTKFGRSMAKSMTESLKIPHLTFSDEVFMDNLIALRKQLNESVASNKKLTFMPFFLKAMSIAITDFPIVNSKLGEDLEEYKEYAHHNISVAIDTPYGLIVPNIKNCELKSLTQIQDELRRLQSLGKENKIPLEDILGGTISLSNVGTLGGTNSVPVIFPPQVFIAGISGIRPVLRKVKGDILDANILGVSFSADHRLIDGATTARFSKRWKQIVETPMLMLLSLK